MAGSTSRRRMHTFLSDLDDRSWTSQRCLRRWRAWYTRFCAGYLSGDCPWLWFRDCNSRSNSSWSCGIETGRSFNVRLSRSFVQGTLEFVRALEFGGSLGDSARSGSSAEEFASAASLPRPSCRIPCSGPSCWPCRIKATKPREVDCHSIAVGILDLSTSVRRYNTMASTRS